MKSSPSSGSRPVMTSTKTSASANTSVHGPVEPCARENCSGAPYAGVNEVTCPLVFANDPAIFCASWTTLAMPKSRIFTVADGAARIAEDEDVRRLHVAVGDPLDVRERERLGRGLEQAHRLVGGPQERAPDPSP